MNNHRDQNPHRGGGGIPAFCLILGKHATDAA